MKRPLLVGAAAHVHDGEREIRALEAVTNSTGDVKPSCPRDVGAHVGGRRRGERRHRRGELLAEGRRAGGSLAEVVPPLADAVRLVHDQARAARARPSDSRKEADAESLGAT